MITSCIPSSTYMKKLFLYGGLLLVSCTSPAPSPPASQQYFPLFKWTITFPHQFEAIDPADWKAQKEKGMEAVEKTFGEEVPDFTSQLFAIRKGSYNVMEANYQPYDESIDGPYTATNQSVNEILYHTLETQIPNAQLDSSAYMDTIGGLPFFVFSFSIAYPSGQHLQTLLYSRLFGDKELGISLSYLDTAAGRAMYEALHTSHFELP